MVTIFTATLDAHQNQFLTHGNLKFISVTMTFCLALLPMDGAAKTFDFPVKNERQSDLSLRARTLAGFPLTGRTNLAMLSELYICNVILVNPE
ncbi:hypothetical protein AVEN_174859-1 [Araneus ventricosus]|uniref:Uncharacterized protein n=1 Tax=Araneus ventricosus TaxID=182803 RepID=A0A4Y2RQB0_ARAVE|nr:hypothetical protein AVEN_36217-1 [Araneus ventricosus]GBN73727.1 hypothetical protein AVEN_208760-1 [Araneus ventricosus]GBN77580.1 hypothetical protein AVEN_125192-1 [Araneus ventricosus]GBN77648.1 hypothetical protein AVEN_174859-1 [Araneus ventricosus]